MDNRQRRELVSMSSNHVGSVPHSKKEIPLWSYWQPLRDMYLRPAAYRL